MACPASSSRRRIWQGSCRLRFEQSFFSLHLVHCDGVDRRGGSICGFRQAVAAENLSTCAWRSSLRSRCSSRCAVSAGAAGLHGKPASQWRYRPCAPARHPVRSGRSSAFSARCAGSTVCAARRMVSSPAIRPYFSPPLRPCSARRPAARRSRRRRCGPCSIPSVRALMRRVTYPAISPAFWCSSACSARSGA